MTAKKKKLIKGLVAVALIAIIGIGATFAYLTATTATKTNKFTGDGNKVDGTVEETQWTTTGEKKASDYIPGDIIAKDPTVQLTKDSEAAFVAVNLKFLGDTTTTGDTTTGTQMTYKQFQNYAQYGTGTTEDNFKANTTNAGWTKIAYTNNGEELWMYDNSVAAGAKPTASLFDSMKVNVGIKTITTTTYPEALYTKTTKYDAKGNVTDQTTTSTKIESGTTLSTDKTYYDNDGNVVTLTKLPHFAIDATGLAVQATNSDQATAKDQLIKLANVGKTAGSDDYYNTIA